MPSNNFVNGLRVNVGNYVPGGRIYANERDLMAHSMSSQEFSSVMKSNPTVNNMSVNLNRPINNFGNTHGNLGAPL